MQTVAKSNPICRLVYVVMKASKGANSPETVMNMNSVSLPSRAFLSNNNLGPHNDIIPGSFLFRFSSGIHPHSGVSEKDRRRTKNTLKHSPNVPELQPVIVQ